MPPTVIPKPRSIVLDGRIRAARPGAVRGADDAIASAVGEILADAPGPRETAAVRLVEDAALIDQHYRLEIPAEGEIVVRSGSPRGFLYGAQTLLALSGAAGIAIGTVDDSPAMRERGVFVESFWGSDLMRLADWKTMVDRFAFLKFTVVGISVYGCWDLRHDGDRGEYLLVPVPGFERLRTPHRFRRWDPQAGVLRATEYLPTMFEENSFGAIVEHARRRGIEIIPFVAGPGHSSLLPREYPALSAVAADGTPTGYGYCVSGTESRRELARFFTSLIAGQFAPAGVGRVGVQADEFFPIRNVLPEDPDRELTPYCACEGCAGRSPGELLIEYLDLVGGVLDEANMGMVHWHDSLLREDALDDYERLLRGRPGREVTISWWGYNDPLPQPGAREAWQTWVTPTPGLIASLLPQDFTINIEQWMHRARESGADGVLAYNTYQPSQARNYAALADAAWAGTHGGGRRGFLERWSARGEDAESSALADDLIASALGSYPLMNYLVQQTLPYFAVASGPRVHYTEDLLRTLTAPFPALTSALRQTRDTVREALTRMPPQPDLGPWTGLDGAWRWELRRVVAHLDLVLAAVEITRRAARGEDTARDLDRLRADGVALLDEICARTPAWLAPITSREHAELIVELPGLVERIRAGEASGFDAPAPWHAWLF